MIQSKFSLADLLAVLAALAFGFVCFLGANFLNIDSVKVWGMPQTTGCIVMAVVCSVLLLGTALGAKLLKRTNRNFKTCFVWEVILLLLFIVFAGFFATKTSPFPHYFTVTAQKSEIMSNLQESINKADSMFIEYESYAENRKTLYRQRLSRVAKARWLRPGEYVEYGFDRSSGVSDDVQIDNKMFTLHADLFPSNYSDTIANKGIKEVATDWLQNAKDKTSTWKPIGIVGVVKDIEENSNDWLKTLVELSEVREQGEEAVDFEYSLLFGDVKTSFTKLESPSPLSIGLTVLVYILMILSWFVAYRSTRFPGLKFLFGLGKSGGKKL
jgi:hypothetical protein